MGHLIVVLAFGLLSLPQSGYAQEKAKMNPGASEKVKISPADQADQSAAMAKEARDRSEALERARDRKMRDVSKSICVGC